MADMNWMVLLCKLFNESHGSADLAESSLTPVQLLCAVPPPPPAPLEKYCFFFFPVNCFKLEDNTVGFNPFMEERKKPLLHLCGGD